MSEEKVVDQEAVDQEPHPPITVFLQQGEFAELKEHELKERAIDAVLSLSGAAISDYQIQTLNPRLVEVTNSPIESEVGNRYLVATPKEYAHIRHTMVFDQLCTMDIDMLLAYVFQDMDPDETKIILFGILQAPDDAISAYTKNRSISMLINFESMLRDFICDEQTDVSGVYKVFVGEAPTGKREDGPIPEGAEFIITEAFMTEVEKEAVQEALHTRTDRSEVLAQAAEQQAE